jgi:5'-nucleotidase
MLPVIAALALVLAAPALADEGQQGPNGHQTLVQLLAFNDFHGNLEPPTGSGGRIQVGVTPTGAAVNKDAGGVEYLATWMKTLRGTNSNTIAVGAGDLIGASPLISALFHDEPTIEAMNLLHLDVNGVGNHEFDKGVSELLRMQYGPLAPGARPDGCHPVDHCQDNTPFGGSLFRFLAANVFYQGTNQTILPPYKIVEIDNVKIAFIGLTLEGTPSIVTPAGVAGLEFRPEVPTVNALVQHLRQTQGVRSFVVLIHQGGFQNPPYPVGYQDINRCDNMRGDIVPIVQALDPLVKVVISGHTHAAYNCTIAGKLVTSAASFGRLITDIDLRIDQQTKEIVDATATNVIVTRDVAKDPDQTALIAHYKPFYDPIANRVVGSQTATITRATTAAGESALGDVIADAQLAASAPTDFGGAVVAFMNPGGIRADLTCSVVCSTSTPAPVTYSQLFTVQPFNNVMTVKTLTGQQIYRLLGQQFDNPSAGQTRILQVSNGFRYSRTNTSVVAGSIEINGRPVDPLAPYRVAMNSFLATGGDRFTVFAEGTNQLGGEIDIDAFVNYFLARSPVAPGPRDRITLVP